jgi:hypothetical protein
MLSAPAKTNQTTIAEIIEIYTWALLVDTFGDIPYENALKVSGTSDDILQPEYSDAASIYNDLISRLNTAIGALDNTAESWGENDLFYNGDIDLWIKLSNSIKLRLGMMLADVDQGLAKTTVEAAAPNVFASNDDNAIFRYLSAPSEY